MTQIDLTRAGIVANIEHYRCQLIAQQNQLELVRNELMFWIAVAEQQLLPPADPDAVK